MDHSIFILCKDEISINRFHICTWDLLDDNACIEIGCEILSFNKKHIDLMLFLSFLTESIEIEDLYEKITERDNVRFIFNDKVQRMDPDEGTGKHGIKIQFEERESLQFLKCEPKLIDKNVISVGLTQSQNNDCRFPIYFRLLIKSKNRKTFSILHKGIMQSKSIYDFKVNEKRNLPDDVDQYINTENLKFVSLKTFFCLNVIPDTYQISFLDSSKLKNVRKLESSSFYQYLPFLKSLKADNYLIVFLKQTSNAANDNFSIFSSYTCEYFGLKQIAITVMLNLFCTFLISVQSSMNVMDPDIPILRQMPVELWIISLSILTFLLWPMISRLYRRIKIVRRKK